MTEGTTAEAGSGLLAELEWRGILHAATPGLPARLARGGRIAGYNGFDPSADSLHVGHLIPIFGLLRFQRHGGTPVALVGGGTGMIGDPSGRSAERNLLDRETLERNVAALRSQLERFLDFSPGTGGAVMVNNLDWLGELSLIDFLRDTGKHFTVPYMLSKDSVQTRLERGLSFTEFSYMLLQAYDFWHLHRVHGVEVQMGGADQWGNITAGLELIRRTSGRAITDTSAKSVADAYVTSDIDGQDETLIVGEEPAHGLAYKLLLSPSGTKFGKSESGESVWLDPRRTSPYAFYQYWLNTDDRDVGTYLRWFTKLTRGELEDLESSHHAKPERREAQRVLARALTGLTHGDDEVRRVEAVSQAIFMGNLSGLDHSLRSFASAYLPTGPGLDEPSPEWAHGLAAAQIAIGSASASSNTDVRRLASQGGLYIEDQPVQDPFQRFEIPVDQRFFVRRGKRNYHVLELAKQRPRGTFVSWRRLTRSLRDWPNTSVRIDVVLRDLYPSAWSRLAERFTRDRVKVGGAAPVDGVALRTAFIRGTTLLYRGFEFHALATDESVFLSLRAVHRSGKRASAFEGVVRALGTATQRPIHVLLDDSEVAWASPILDRLEPMY